MTFCGGDRFNCSPETMALLLRRFYGVEPALFRTNGATQIAHQSSFYVFEDSRLGWRAQGSTTVTLTHQSVQRTFVIIC